MPLIKQCICSCPVFLICEMHGLTMHRCAKCGVLHQSVDMTEDDLREWYESWYHNKVYTRTYSHDLAVAKKRIDSYGYKLQQPILDVGCGNGAFVDACLSFGLKADGQDLGGGYGYNVPIDEISGVYSSVTMHDVLEHVVDPRMMLREVRRLGRSLIIDFPGFFHPAGKHHWKPIEHLWMLTEEQVCNLVTESGFTIYFKENPIPGKITLYAK